MSKLQTKASVDPSLFQVVDATFAEVIHDLSVAQEPEHAEVAFAGRSNVGKSSLMNCLMGRRNLVRTSSTPGCTRQINVFALRLKDGLGLRFVDLPGFGYAKRSKTERVEWASVVEQYLSIRQALKVLVLLVDVRRGAEEEEARLLEFLAGARALPLSVLVVGTKADKVGPQAAQTSVAQVSQALGVKAIAASAQTGKGREEVWREILRLLSG